MNDTDSGQEVVLTGVLLQAGKETWRGWTDGNQPDRQKCPSVHDAWASAR